MSDDSLKIVLTRIYQNRDVTLGSLDIRGIEHQPLFTLENPWKDNKRNISCIPEGIYKCLPYDGTKYKDVYLVTDVLNRGAILFHVGNYERNTQGCILPGLGINYSTEAMVSHSSSAMNIMRRIIEKREFVLKVQSV